MCRAGLVDIDAHNGRVRMKIFLPHAERAAAKYADLQHANGSVAKSLKVPRIDIEIVMPFVDIRIG